MDLKKVYEGLKAPFPDEAYSKDSSRGFDLTSLKAQYAIERLNDVLGIAGWNLKGGFEKTEKGVLYIGELQLVENGQAVHSVEAIGYADNKKNTGDTYKSARTDALSKAASYYGLGNEMFKGNIQVGGSKDFKKKAPAKSTTKTTKKTENKEEATKPNFRRKKASSKPASSPAGGL